MEMEHEAEDWHGRGYVVRICAMCDEAEQAIQGHVGPPYCDKDDLRTTGFQPPSEAIDEWNERFGLP